MLFDTHAHYDDEKFNEDRHEVIKRAHESGVAYILNAATDLASAAECVALAETYDFVYGAAGIHPHNVEAAPENALETIADLLRHPKISALGEIGLDYYYDFAPRELQKQWFRQQIALARNMKKPIIVHNRDSHEDVMKILRESDAGSVGGVFHCYTGSVEMARELLNNNFYISVGGPVTFKNAKRIVEVVKYVPEDRLLIETDCPYLTPEPHRGKRNDSAYVRLVAEKIAEIRGTTFEHVAGFTTENAKRLFGIS